jgi:hypothetical protein
VTARPRRLAVVLAALTIAAVGAASGIPAAATPGPDDGSELVTTPSTTTVRWTDPDQPARNPDDGPDAADPRVYEALADFELRVSQTRDLRNQTVQVSWTGGRPGTSLQLMQCWSRDARTPPDREHCAYGANFFNPNSFTSQSRVIGDRSRESEYAALTRMEVLSFDGRAARNAVGTPVDFLDRPRTLGAGVDARPNPLYLTWFSDTRVRYGNDSPCPAGTATYGLTMTPPPDAATERGPVPRAITVVPAGTAGPEQATATVPGAADRSFAAATAEFTFADVAERANVPGDAWPFGKYTLELRCADAAGTLTARLVTAAVRDTVTQDGQETAYWRQPTQTAQEQPAAVVPFDPFGDGPFDGPTSDVDPAAVLEFFQPRTTNEVASALNRVNGSGVATFETLTDLEAQHLGCGRVSDDAPACWLVAVPRWAPVRVAGSDPPEFTAPSLQTDDGPLTQSVWDLRVQVPLEFAPVAAGCTIGSGLRQILTHDSALAAFRSWQSQFCRDADTASTVSRPLQDFQIRGAVGADDNRLGVVGVPDAGAPGQVVAPVATSGVVVAFVVDRLLDPADPDFAARNQTRATTLNLTPRLVAKLLTQSYDWGAAPNGGRTGTGYNGDQELFDTVLFDHSFDPPRNLPADNPRNLYEDPEFLAVNPDFRAWAPARVERDVGRMATVIVSANDTDAYNVVWRWILSDPDARAFLDGEPDPDGMTVNPYYRGFATDQLSSFQILDPTCADILANPVFDRMPPICTFNYQSRTETDAESAQAAVRGDSLRRSVPPSIPTGGFIDPTELTWRSEPRQAPDFFGTQGVSLLAVTTTAVAEQFGLPTASLGTAERGFTRATPETMARARAGMTPREDGVLVPAPGEVAGDAYPLTTMSYAVVDACVTTEDQRSAFADVLDYAAGEGQVPGRAPGRLPPGYLPLDGALTDQARAAADRLRVPGDLLTQCPSPPAPSPTPAPVAAPPVAPGPGAPPPPPGEALPPTLPAPAGSPPPGPVGPGPAAAPVAADPAADLAVTRQSAAVATPDVAIVLRWVLPLVLAVGLVGAAVGPAVTLAGRRRSRRGDPG